MLLQTSLFGHENGWGGGGASAFPPHLHLDKFITSVGRGRRTIDSFNYAQGQGSVERSSAYMKVDNLSAWYINSDKIGLWFGEVVKVKRYTPLFWDAKGARAVMKTLAGEEKQLYVWQGEFRDNLNTIAHHLVGTRIQVSVYDNIGAFNPNILVNISDLE